VNDGASTSHVEQVIDGHLPWGVDGQVRVSLSAPDEALITLLIDFKWEELDATVPHDFDVDHLNHKRPAARGAFVSPGRGVGLPTQRHRA
jgi:hypothetical protein